MSSYYTGSVSDLDGLLSVIQTVAVEKSWTLNAGILSKGRAYIRPYVLNKVTGNDGPGILLEGGTGSSGDKLTGAYNVIPRLGRPAAYKKMVDITWPARYHIFAYEHPDEIYVILNFNVTDYYWCAFGVSDIPGLPGSGLWMAATTGRLWSTIVETSLGWSVTANGGNWSGNPTPSGGIFFQPSTYYYENKASAICAGFDGVDWYGNGLSNTAGSADACLPSIPHFARSESAWNSESALIRIQVMAWRTGNRCSLAADLKNARYIRLRNYEPEQVIHLGMEKWKVFPFFRKNADVPHGGDGIDHTGTFGWALRYEGA